VMQYQPQESPITNTAIVVHQNVSPNGDGNSDALVIEGIAAHPDNKIQIMNRSGALVYEAKGYDNATKSFDGHSSTNGKLQQPGTYFYSLEYKDGNETKHKTGFIVLKY
uniref:gliding motility-associated C-terminal domain-containing protein n=1 Tax=Mucilaginibacter sp. TaxID=1882438 RepID=UPI0025F52DCD